ncbi:MAG: VOC family protein [Acidobacteriota bacterium]|nr:VOC family protein [Acidobacteriota bacterium]
MLMMKIKAINHVTMIVDDLAKSREFYTNVLGLEELPAFNFDYPVQFYKINDRQQLHLSEWADTASFRGHLCVEVEDFNEAFRRCKELGVIDTRPWGRVRQIKGSVMQMFIRDPAGNLIEISHPDASTVDPEIFKDELFEQAELFVSGREDARGKRGEGASLYEF